MSNSLKYTGPEALEMVKEYYPKDWQIMIENATNFLQERAIRYNMDVKKVYRKFVLNGDVGATSKIAFFAALSIIHEKQKMTNSEKSKRIIELDDKRILIAKQIVALEADKITSYEDKKILRSYYNKLREQTNKEYNELLNSFEVIEPKRIIFQIELFGNDN